MSVIDSDAIVACADLARRSGATSFTVGYLHDNVPVEEAGWYAEAVFRGAKLIGEGRSPDGAADALAHRLLDGATCTRCHEPITLADSSRGCRWRRFGETWRRGCGT